MGYITDKELGEWKRKNKPVTGKPRKIYLDNTTFHNEIMKCKETGVISNELGALFIKLCENVGKARSFVRYPYKEDMIATGLQICCQAFVQYDPDKYDPPRPHGYFSMVVHRAFITVIQKEQKQRQAKDEVLIYNGLNPSDGYEDRKILEQKRLEEKERKKSLSD